ncbi:MAG: hypothetical protein LRY57_04795 [Alphaproteobacteria bacterium]|nr:hypothetical protein [Alphaproteobacteria bacterium]
MSDDNKGQGILARLWENFSPAPALNPDNKKVVFLVGRNATAHHILRHAVPALAGLGIHVDIYLTRMPDNPKLQEKLNIPENKRFSFYEQLPINIIYPCCIRSPLSWMGLICGHHCSIPRSRWRPIAKSWGSRSTFRSLMIRMIRPL